MREGEFDSSGGPPDTSNEEFVLQELIRSYLAIYIYAHKANHM